MIKLVHQFTASCHRKMFITSLFNIYKSPSESLRDYLSHFNKATIKVVPPNQEILMGAFQNGLKLDHFNESLTQNPMLPLADVVSRVGCYIKGKESNAEKKARNVKNRVPGAERSRPLRCM